MPYFRITSDRETHIRANAAKNTMSLLRELSMPPIFSHGVIVEYDGIQKTR